MCQGVNPDVKYEVQYSSYVNVTSDGFMILKRVVKTESFALQVSDLGETRSWEIISVASTDTCFSFLCYQSVLLPAAQGGGHHDRGVWHSCTLCSGHTW